MYKPSFKAPTRSKKPFSERKPIVYNEQKLYNYGINRLSSRDYSRKELFDRMVRFQEDTSMVDKVLDKLEEQGYLSDMRRAKSILNQYDRRESIHKTRNRIRQKGVSMDTLEEVLAEKEENAPVNESEFSIDTQKAYDILLKKYHTYDTEKWDKMVRFLASRGFKYADINQAIQNLKNQDKLTD